MNTREKIIDLLYKTAEQYDLQNNSQLFVEDVLNCIDDHAKKWQEDEFKENGII